MGIWCDDTHSWVLVSSAYKIAGQEGTRTGQVIDELQHIERAKRCLGNL